MARQDVPAEPDTRRLDRLPLEPAPLPLGETAPDPEALVVAERVLQALRPDLAATAYPLGLAGRAALLREEGLRIRLRAQRAILPALLRGIIRANAERIVHQRDDDVCHCTPPCVSPRAPAPVCFGARIT